MARTRSPSQVTFGGSPKEIRDNPHHLRLYLERMRNDTDTHDVIFVVDGEKFPAQRSLISAASPVLRCMLTNGMKESKQTEIELKEVEVEAWKLVMNYFYAARIDVVDVDNALKVVECAHRFQIEELVQDLCEYVREQLTAANCGKILSFADRNSLVYLRTKTMDFVVNNFSSTCQKTAFATLPCDIVLEIVKYRNLVVRGELDVFNGIMRWLLGTDDVESENEIDAAIAKRGVELLKKVGFSYLFNSCPMNNGPVRLMQDHSTLLQCIDVDNLSHVDGRRVGRFCRDLLIEAKTEHNIELPHIQELGDRIFDKLILSPSLSAESPVSPYLQAHHDRYCDSITFRHRFYGIQQFMSPSASIEFHESSVFEDRNHGIKWWLYVYFRGSEESVRDKSLSCFVQNECGDSEWKEMQVTCEVFVVTSTSDDPMEPPKSSRVLSIESCQSFETSWGYTDMLPTRKLDGIDSIVVGCTLYFKPKVMT